MIGCYVLQEREAGQQRRQRLQQAEQATQAAAVRAAAARERLQQGGLCEDFAWCRAQEPGHVLLIVLPSILFVVPAATMTSRCFSLGVCDASRLGGCTPQPAAGSQQTTMEEHLVIANDRSALALCSAHSSPGAGGAR